VHKWAARLVKKLGLEKHPEGGYFKQTYRSDATVNLAGFDGPRNISTAIYYMLAGNEFSAFHRLRSDEVWHHYAGGALILYTISAEGKLSKIKIGRGGVPQAVIGQALGSRRLLPTKDRTAWLAAPCRRALATATGSLAKETSL
jgi:predicted cupin superfamily sugar epimerase